MVYQSFCLSPTNVYIYSESNSIKRMNVNHLNLVMIMIVIFGIHCSERPPDPMKGLSLKMTKRSVPKPSCWMVSDGRVKRMDAVWSQMPHIEAKEWKTRNTPQATCYHVCKQFGDSWLSPNTRNLSIDFVGHILLIHKGKCHVQSMCMHMRQCDSSIVLYILHVHVYN